MKKIKTLSAISLLVFAVSCSKSGSDVPPPVSSKTKQIKELVYTDPSLNVESEFYTYDQQGRIKSATYGNWIYSLSYETPTKMKVTRSTNGTIDQERDCTLNEKGAVTKMIYKSVPGGNITYTYEMEYDANGYVTKVIGVSNPSGNNFEETFEIVDGNAVSSKLYHDGVLSHSRIYMYDATKPNKLPFSNWYFWPSETLFGKPMKNLMTEFKSFDPNNVIDWHTTTTYQLDSDGYPVKYTTNYVHANTKSTTELKY